MTVHNKGKYRLRRLAGVLWFVGLVIAFEAYWITMANVVVRNFWDPPYEAKYKRLQARMKEYPGHPLWVMLGTSRVEFGVQPEALADRMGEEGAPLVYNFGLSGAGIFRQFIYLRRLLEDGVKPAGVGIEIFTADLNSPLTPPELPEAQVRARWSELGEYAAYSGDPAKLLANWRRSRWDPICKYGMGMPNQTLRCRLIPLPGTWSMDGLPYDKWGWITKEFSVTGNDYHANFLIAKKGYEKSFVNFQILPKTDEMLRRMLELCRSAGVKAFLLKMPENEDFRALHAHVDAEVDGYLVKIEGDFHVPLVDASHWIAQEGFFDGHHMNKTGGMEFTRRLAGELAALKP